MEEDWFSEFDGMISTEDTEPPILGVGWGEG